MRNLTAKVALKVLEQDKEISVYFDLMVKWFTDIKGMVYLRLFCICISKTVLVIGDMVRAQMVSALFAWFMVYGSFLIYGS